VPHGHSHVTASGEPIHTDLDPTVDSAPARGWRGWTIEILQHEQARLAEFGGIVVAGFVAAVVLLYAFAWLAYQVLDQETQTLDLSALHFLQRLASPDLTLAARLLSLMGSEAVVVLGVVLLAMFGWQQRWGAAFVLILVTGGAQVLNDVLKELFHRTRPEPVTGLIHAQNFSFPSGHAMVSAAFYFYLAYLSWRFVHGWWRGALVGSLILLVLLIGLSRLYLEAHYLSDVIAGYLAGFLWTDAVTLGSRLLAVRPQRLRARRMRQGTLNG
jgi:membrane-associated phospholipid phosphatase